jgi:hypothetical protein
MLIANREITIERLRNDGPFRHAGSNAFTFGKKGVEKISNCRAGGAGCQFWLVEQPLLGIDVVTKSSGNYRDTGIQAFRPFQYARSCKMRNWRWSSLHANAGLQANAILKADASLLHDGFVMQVEHPCARLRDPATTATARR